MRLRLRMRVLCRAAAFAVLFICGFVYHNAIRDHGEGGLAGSPEGSGLERGDLVIGGGASRRLLNTTTTKFERALKSGDEWMMAIYIPLIFYMFLALAIICDEFFVPALEVHDPTPLDNPPPPHHHR